jgi:hypothetical protein
MPITYGIFIVAAVATAFDWAWYTVGIPHTITAGIVHGAALLGAVGAVLGAAQGRLVKGLPIGALAGIGGAAAYYLIVATFGGGTYGLAIPAAWVILWFILAALDGRWLRSPERRPWQEAFVRGAVAAVLSGSAFYAVLDVLWGQPPEGGRNYVVQFLAWTIAWGPGLLALDLRKLKP